MKTCCICKIPKLLSDYNRKTSRKDGLQPHCRTCSHERFALYYKANTAKHIKSVKKRARATQARYRDLLWGYLEHHPCVDCGESDPVVLEFDHVRDTKRAAVTKLIIDCVKWETVLLEIEKCEVRCSNCHHRATYKRAGSWRHMFKGR